MSISTYIHIDDMIDDKFTQKEKEFSMQMAMMHTIDQMRSIIVCTINPNNN